ncbi:protein cueball-like [Antedon mediterranea]|uniref:protein cueball-like n=1 Tax=Antedon mediterranea TaxID=105859 RepID=UPI003AF790AA
MDGTNRQILIYTGLRRPFGIELDTTNGYLYWTSIYSDKANIERVKLNDLSTRTALVKTEMEVTYRLVLAATDGKMYWCDSWNKVIEEANLNGTNRTTIATGLDYPFRIDIYGNYLYWTDSGVIYRVDITTGESSIENFFSIESMDVGANETINVIP